MSVAAIALSGVRFGYGAQPVLDGVDLRVEVGQIFGLVGADGAGKSTLLRLAVGQLQPTAGSVTVLGRNATDRALRVDIAYMPQGFGLYQDLSILENLQFFADLHGLAAHDASARITDLLQRTGLKGFEHRRAGQLSGGMMQKLALSCALVTRPRVMVLDEPTTGVDPLSRRSFWRLLDRVRAEGVSILYATANMDEAERCDRVGMLERGRLLRQGTAQELTVRDDAYLVGVSGANVRLLRTRVRGLPGVLLTFPVGLQLNVWLDRRVALDEFQEHLRAVDVQLSSHRITPTLHDAALRDLALAAGAQ